MAEEALCVLGCDGVERRPERLMQGVGGAGCDLAQPPLHLGPNRLDWVQIQRVRRQIVVAEPGAIEKLPHGFRLVSREVVHYQHGIGFDLWRNAGRSTWSRKA